MVAVIPVALQPEPENFDGDVRKKGIMWLNERKNSLNSPPPKASLLPNYWVKTNRQLYDAYSGICAYLAIFFEWVTGAGSTEHFIAKSVRPSHRIVSSEKITLCFSRGSKAGIAVIKCGFTEDFFRSSNCADTVCTIELESLTCLGLVTIPAISPCR